MSLEVIIPAYRPDDMLIQLTDMLFKQTVVPDKIRILLTCDDISEVYALQDEISRDIVVEQILPSQFGHGATRQYGMDTSEADYVLFMTQDAVPADRFLVEKMLQSFNDATCAAVYARQVPRRDASYLEKYSRLFNYPTKSHICKKEDLETKGIKAVFCSDTCMMYNRSIHEEVGGFERKADFNEDSIFAYNAIMKGYYIGYNACARVFHSHNFSLKEQFVRSYKISKCQKQFAYIYSDIPSEKEGMKFFKTGVKYFLKKNKPFQTVNLFIYCAVRYLGYFIGKRF